MISRDFSVLPEEGFWKNCCSERTNRYIEFYCGIVLSRHSIASFIIVKFLIFLPWSKEGFASHKQSRKKNFDHEFKEQYLSLPDIKISGQKVKEFNLQH